jgi:hypothetical protein
MATTGGNRRRTRSAKAVTEETTSQTDEIVDKANTANTDTAKVETEVAATAKAETADTEAKASNAVEVEEIMADQTKVTTNGDASKPGKLDLAQKPEPEDNGHSEVEPGHEHGLIVHGQGTNEIEIAETFMSAGLRPIGASHLDIAGFILNNRPIMASHLHVMEYSLPGQRPVFASDMIIRDDLTLPGGRPIMASDPHLMESGMITGGRPIASNEIDDGETLMGFLD